MKGIGQFSMHILVLNWRDIRNPRAGGAEVLTHEIARRWAAQGHTVTLLTERFVGAQREEWMDGVRVVRVGKWWSVHVGAMLYYLTRLRSSVDVIVDEVHWFPFFSVLYAPRKTVLLVCEVAHPLFFRLFPFPVAYLGRLLEKLYMLLYRAIQTMAISQSTKEALLAEGIRPDCITVLPMGVTLPARVKRVAKEPRLTLIVLGRLHVLKGIADAMDAFSRIRRSVSDARLWIVGGDTGGYRKQLEQRARDAGITAGVRFFGCVSERKKWELLARSHILLMLSVHEGWGLVVAEAASLGTPSIGYRTAGVKDVIVDGRTGVLVEPGRWEQVAEEARRLWRDKRRYKRFQEAGKRRALSMSWDDTARVAMSVLERTHERP